MQTSFRPEKVLSPTENLAVQPGHTVVVWSPEILNLSHKNVGIQIIPARELIQLHDQISIERDTSEAFYSSDLSEGRGQVPVVHTAYACALEIGIAYGARGMVIVDSFLDTSEAAVLAFENKLRSVGWFDEPRLDLLLPMLGKIVPSNKGEAQALERLEHGIREAVQYRLSKADDWMGEAQRAREGKMGRASLTREEFAYLKEIGLEIPESITAPMPTTAGVDAATLEDKLAQRDKVFAETLAEALGKFGTDIMKATLAAKEGGNDAIKQENTKESSEEAGKSKSIPAVGKPGRPGQQATV